MGNSDGLEGGKIPLALPSHPNPSPSGHPWAPLGVGCRDPKHFSGILGWGILTPNPSEGFWEGEFSPRTLGGSSQAAPEAAPWDVGKAFNKGPG